ncbi:capsule biosynthesis protein [Methylorubrum salsuginis]|uniref:Capsular polysaccharide transport system permease protein n=1 Tax=Methylorubrum salsuginis TaxID=414703 RepID=A0A1I3Y7S8_9HYPH|nr:capsule biosynthesis protein [Methylorubrum salsuginis]SFK28037.1 capsular polysaccharide transport system permease protein [Methylorubrum salsuginis]
MSSDEVKQETKVRSNPSVQSLIDLARRSVPDLRRNAETIEPVPARRGGPLVARVRRTLDWTRLPGLRRREEARPQPRLLVRLVRSYALFVLVPTAAVGFYVFVLATPQYVAESQFAVRGDIEPMANTSLGVYQELIQKHNSQDSFILRDYIRSRPLVEAVDAKLGLQTMFSQDGIDFWARYNSDQPVERLVRYWRDHVTPQIDVVSGVIRLTVRAFSPQDAVAISKEVIAQSETLINTISRRAQQDMLTQAQKEVDKAVERLKRARTTLQEFRNRWGIIDPSQSAQATATTIELLRKDKIKAENDLRVLRDSKLDEKTRSIQVLVATVAAIDGQMKDLQNRLTTDGLVSDASHNLTQALLEYEGLMVEQTIAEKLNASMNMILDRARVAASKQQIYLATYVEPLLPSYSAYPAPFYAVGVALFLFTMFWSALSLIRAAVVDNRL